MPYSAAKKSRLQNLQKKIARPREVAEAQIEPNNEDEIIVSSSSSSVPQNEVEIANKVSRRKVSKVSNANSRRSLTENARASAKKNLESARAALPAYRKAKLNRQKHLLQHNERRHKAAQGGRSIEDFAAEVLQNMERTNNIQDELIEANKDQCSMLSKLLKKAGDSSKEAEEFLAEAKELYDEGSELVKKSKQLQTKFSDHLKKTSAGNIQQ